MKTDLDLKKDVESELNWEPSVNAAHIGVSAKAGVVTLNGHVPSYAEKFAAEQATKRVYGVLAVANELDVRLGAESKRTDDEIAAACLAALRASYSVPADKVKLVVSKGWVQMDGQLEWDYQRTAAYKCVRDIRGVVGVSNNLRVTPRVSVSDVQQKIEAALRRNAELDARRIRIEAHDGKVTLHGSVRAWMERDEAERAAWAAPGVTTVENDIRISA